MAINVSFTAVLLSISLLVARLTSEAGNSENPPREPPAIGSETAESELVSLLKSTDGSLRMKATAEVFRRGKAMLPALERAGARPMARLNPPRLDVVYSLLKGITPSETYLKDSIGLHLQGAVSRPDVVRLGKKHGLTLPEFNQVRPGSSPTCYVNLAAGKSLFKVIRELLEQEPSVVTINLNYTES